VTGAVKQFALEIQGRPVEWIDAAQLQKNEWQIQSVDGLALKVIGKPMPGHTL
jgi:hypothetical protein